MPFNIDQIIKNVSRVKLSGGIVGRVCHVLIFIAISMAIIAWSIKLLLVSVISLCMIFILAFVILWRLINFAYKNPQAALMEGAELLIHEQMVISSKNSQEKIVNQSDLTINKPLLLSPEEKIKLDKADTQERIGN